MYLCKSTLLHIFIIIYRLVTSNDISSDKVEKSNTLTVIVPDYASLNTSNKQPEVKMTVNPSYGTKYVVGMVKNPSYGTRPVVNCRKSIQDQHIYEWLFMQQ